MICLRLPIAMGLAVVLFTACASSPQASFYTLSAQPLTQAAPVVSSGPSAIAIGAVTVQEIVDRPQIVVRTDANEVKFDEYARWADSLKNQIRRTVAADLAMQFPSAIVYGNAGAPDPASTYQVSVDVLSFESVPGTAATIVAQWSIRVPKGEALNGRSVISEPTAGPGYDMLIAAHSRALARVSDDIAVAIRLRMRK